MRIRRFRLAEAEACHAVYVASVREGATRFYSEDERLAWAPNDQPPGEWRDRLSDNVTYVAEDEGVLAGFMSMTRDGHLDMAYVAPACMGRGVADRLYGALTCDPELAALARYEVQASHFSRRFLLKKGWSDAAPETVDRFGRKLVVFRMELRRA